MNDRVAAYFTRDEVVIHNSQDDMWVSVNGNVLDLTNLFASRIDSMNDSLRLLLTHAGKDLSWAFDKKGFPLMRINQYGKSVPVFPPVVEKEKDKSDFWWQGAPYIVGMVTCLERRIRVINTLTRKVIFMNICEEDSLNVIKAKYRKGFNENADSYIWRKSHSQDDDKNGLLFMHKTLTQNGILYQRHEQLGLPPAIWLFFISNC